MASLSDPSLVLAAGWYATKAQLTGKAKRPRLTATSKAEPLPALAELGATMQMSRYSPRGERYTACLNGSSLAEPGNAEDPRASR